MARQIIGSSTEPSLVNPEAERTLLGRILADETEWWKVCDGLVADDFGLQQHADTFRGMAAISKLGKTISIPTLISQVKSLNVDYNEISIGSRLASFQAEATRPELRKVDTAQLIAIIKHRSVCRALVAAADKIKERAQSVSIETPIENLIDESTRLISSHDLADGEAETPTIGRLVSRVISEAESARISGKPRGLRTGLRCFDDLVGPILPGQVIIIAGETGMGKALDLATPIATPDGWTTMAEVKKGDFVFGDDGKSCRVIGTSAVMYDHRCYSVKFSDGAEIIADEDHLWVTSTHDERLRQMRGWRRKTEKLPRQSAKFEVRRYSTDDPKNLISSVRTTAEIKQTIRRKGGDRNNHTIPTARPLALPSRHLLLDPYVLGAWLGDGKSNGAAIYCSDEDVGNYIRQIEAAELAVDARKRKSSWEIIIRPKDAICLARDGRRETITPILASLGVLGCKHIPLAYLRASYEQRVALLQGLMDTDGYVERNGRCEFCVCDERLAQDFRELITGLGIKSTLIEGPAVLNKKIVGTRFRISFVTDIQVGRLTRKLARFSSAKWTNRVARQRSIVSVDEVSSRPVKCIAVDNASHLYLAGREMVPTHNTALATELAFLIAKQGMPVRINSLEMEGTELATRMIAKETGLDGDRIADGNVTSDDTAKMMEAGQKLIDLPLSIDSRPGPTVGVITGRLARAKARENIKAGMVDHLQYIMPDSRKGRENEQIKQVADDIKAMAKRLQIPMFIISHLSRHVDFSSINCAADVKRPTLSALYGSSAIEKAADAVVFVHRPAWFLERATPSEKYMDRYYSDLKYWRDRAELVLPKRRGGKGFMVRECIFDGARTWFTDISSTADLPL